MPAASPGDWGNAARPLLCLSGIIRRCSSSPTNAKPRVVSVGRTNAVRQAPARPDDVKAVSTPVSAARFRSNFVRVGMLKSNPKLNPDQNVIPVGDGRVRANVVKEGHGFRY